MGEDWRLKIFVVSDEFITGQIIDFAAKNVSVDVAKDVMRVSVIDGNLSWISKIVNWLRQVFNFRITH